MPAIPENISNALKKLPDQPGIYLYYNTAGELIYVGKAVSLKNRVRSYWSGQRTPRPIEEMIHEVTRIDWREADSALEAAILEAINIKQHQPRYNVLGKDDKSWNYIVITKESFPRVQTIRQHDFEKQERQGVASKKLYKNIFGPFPGLNAKATLTLLRKMFRYSTCNPNKGRPCLYREIGQCLGVCTGEITSQEYGRRVIKPLVIFLGGKKKQVMSQFKREMVAASKQEDYETAAIIRDQLNALSRIHDMAILNDSFFKDPALTLEGPTRVRLEGYDISNLGATEKVGSMVVFNNSGPIKSDYRKFIVKTVEGQSDVDSLAEVLNRRLNHPEWPLPTIFLIDGGRPQVSTAQKVIWGRGIAVPIVGIAKGPERKRNDFIIPNPPQGAKDFLATQFKTKEILYRWVQAHEKLLIAVRDESHRFAITFHRNRRAKRLKING